MRSGWLFALTCLSLAIACQVEHKPAPSGPPVAAAPPTTRPTPAPTPPPEPYRFRPKVNTFDAISRNVEIEELKDGVTMKGLGKGSTIAMAVPFGGTGSPQYMPDAPGSRDIHVIVNEKMGYTTFAGLRFQGAAVVGVRTDGLVVVDKEGIRARDAKGRLFVSGKTTAGDKDLIAMLGPITEK